MATRRFHTKTRRGCSQCKSRKTKCDEVKPNCLKCIKRRTSCSFSESSLTIIPSYRQYKGRNDLIAVPSLTDTRLSTEPIFKPFEDKEQFSLPNFFLNSCKVMSTVSCLHLPQEERANTFELLHHYSVYTCATISNARSTLPIWRDALPALAFEHDFLLSTLLAVASLHLAIVCPSEKYNRAAMYHQTRALAGFRLELTSINPTNASAIFASACLMPMYALGIHRTSLRCLDTLSELYEIFTLLRGIAAVTKIGAQWPEIQFPDPSVQPLSKRHSPLPERIEVSFSILSARLSRSMSDKVSQNAYKTAIDELRHSFLLAQDFPNNKRVIIPFPIICPQRVMAQLKEQEPSALVILAHYAVLLHWLKDDLWITSWGEDILNAVSESVGSEWHDCLEWPRKEIRGA